MRDASNARAARNGGHDTPNRRDAPPRPDAGPRARPGQDADAAILIVGAGPVGLTAAIELTRRGRPVRIIDKAAGPATGSRALAVNARSLQLLEPCGATPALLARGLRITRANFHERDGRTASLDIAQAGIHDRSLAAQPYPFILSLPQEEIETVLIDTLAGLGVTVEWNSELTGATLQEGRARCTIATPHDSGDSRPALVIAADGAHSTMRHCLGLPFRGERFERDWGLADALIQGDVAHGEVHGFFGRAHLFAMIPLPEPGVFRLVSDAPDVIAALPPHLRVRDILWRTTFRISSKQVLQYQAGNVFLAGDAAHIHSPVGGRGMNLGIEDAAWLAWLIAQGCAEDYHRLRFAVGRETVRLTDLATRFIASRDPVAAFARRHALLPLLGSAWLQRRLLPVLLGLAGAPHPPWLADGNH